MGRRRCRWPTAWSRCWFMACRALSTQGSRGAPKGACREEAGVRGDTSCRQDLEEGAEWGLRGAGLGQGTVKGELWGRKTWLCPHCCFLSPPQQGRNKSPRPRRVVLLGEGAGTGSVRCLHQPLPPTRTPSSRPTPQGKSRASAPWAEENRAGSLASSGFHLPAPSPLGSRT